MDLNERDDQGSTALHWAIFSHSELSTLYIIAWLNDLKLKLDQQDESGNTPMHTAVIASEQLGSVRPVKVLLFNAAPQDMVNHAKETPLDVAKSLNDEEIKEAVIQLLQKKQSLMEYFQLSTPLRKVERSWGMTIAFFTINITVLGFCALFIFPLWSRLYEVLIVASLFDMANLFFIVSMCHDPGFIQPHREVDFLVSFYQSISFL